MTVRVVETVAGMWFYHLRVDGDRRTLCGRGDVMSTEVPLSAWGSESHLPTQKWCKTCKVVATSRGLL